MGKGRKNGAIVVVSIDTGEEIDRAALNETGTMGMFLCPGFKRDFYVCSIEGTVARVFVNDEEEGEGGDGKGNGITGDNKARL